MRLVPLVAIAVLTACSGAPSVPSGVAAPPVSKQTSTSDAQQRAKVHTELGSLYLNDGRVAVAQDEARTAIQNDSSYAPAYGLMGLVHMTLGENTAADEYFRKALSIAPGDPEINNNYGWFLCQNDRERQAIPYFMTAIRNPLYAVPAKPLTSLGLCYYKMHEEKLAEEYFGKGLRANPGNVEAIYWLGEIYLHQGRYNEAKANVASLHKLMEPNSQSLWLALRIDRKLGDREGEARYASLLRRKFQGTPEYQKMMQGQYE